MAENKGFMNDLNGFADKFLTGSMWVRSLREFKRLNVVTFCGMMCALAMVLNMVASISLGPYIRIGFSGLPNQVVAYLFGPAVGGIFGAALDIIKYLIKPEGAFFPGFTVSAALGGIIYGAFLYKERPTILRVLAAQLFVKVFVNLLLNTLWLNMLYGKGFLAILPGRIVSNAVMLPIDTAIMFFMLGAVDRTIKKYFDDSQKESEEDRTKSEEDRTKNEENRIESEDYKTENEEN